MGASGNRCVRVKDEYLQGVLDKRERLLFDGAMGTMIQKNGLVSTGPLELLCLDEPEAVTDIHRAYVQAGSQVVTTNTFGANAMKLDGIASVDDVYAAAVACARESGTRYVAADIGPLGELLDPYGDITYDEAYGLFAEAARAAGGAGADLVIVETMTDLTELTAAVRAALDSTDLPVFATMTFGEGGRTFMGVSPEDAVETLEELGVDALGINCSLGPESLLPFAQTMLDASEKPVIVQANAGLPAVSEGETRYSIGPAEYAAAVRRMLDAGVTIVGGCCGTDPAYIEQLSKALSELDA